MRVKVFTHGQARGRPSRIVTRLLIALACSAVDTVQYCTVLHYCQIDTRVSRTALGARLDSRSMQQAGIRGLATSLNSAGKYMHKVRAISHTPYRPFSHLPTKVTRGRGGSPRHRRRYGSKHVAFYVVNGPHMLTFPLRPEREASLGLRSRAHFYSAFRTSRRYSSSGTSAQARRRGKAS